MKTYELAANILIDEDYEHFIKYGESRKKAAEEWACAAFLSGELPVLGALALWMKTEGRSEDARGVRNGIEAVYMRYEDAAEDEVITLLVAMNTTLGRLLEDDVEVTDYTEAAELLRRVAKDYAADNAELIAGWLRAIEETERLWIANAEYSSDWY